mmetsp:Transcript_26722/g.57454  ORF Transcript_26722/g.57454 Transcript_26722/m.57454 type:complete len:141 (+) Transcript_26722:404-826(+)
MDELMIKTPPNTRKKARTTEQEYIDRVGRFTLSLTLYGGNVTLLNDDNGDRVMLYELEEAQPGNEDGVAQIMGKKKHGTTKMLCDESGCFGEIGHKKKFCIEHTPKVCVAVGCTRTIFFQSYMCSKCYNSKSYYRRGLQH